VEREQRYGNIWGRVFLILFFREITNKVFFKIRDRAVVLPSANETPWPCY